MSELNEFGREVFDQTPVEFPIHFDRPTPLHIRLRQQILNVYENMRLQNDVETPEEADDFNMPEDSEMWNSPYEGDFDHMQDEKFTSATNAESSPHEDAETPPAKPEDSPKE